MADKESLLKELSRCVLEMEDEEVIPVAQEYADNGFDAAEGIMQGLVPGMNQAADLYEQEEYFIPELMVCSAAMYNGLDVLKPLIPKENTASKGKAVIGVVEGDTHDIGKNLVKIMMDTAGFEMYDLGRDVPLDNFVDKALEVGASIICMSTLMTTTMAGMKTVIEKLEEKGVRSQFKIMVGGSPISQKYADEIGADGYSVNAVGAVKAAKKLVGIA